ncbi:MAG: 4-oxalomesaconate tautomerase [Alphaproteobacteria bacterium]|nr:MAG: 4-oxalomesaconate tautomerase [Alphaproteobacteria bacterium]
MQTAIPCALMRGGSSKGLYFLGKDLPSEEALRDRVLLAAMGGSDPRQIDGLGGAHPLTSKIAIVSPSALPGVDVDYLFVQAVVGEDRVDLSPTCGNILAGVGPFALEKGLVTARGDITRVSVYMVNTGKICELSVVTPGGCVSYDGEAAIDGVPGTGSPIICDFPDAAGSSCGSLLPTGNVRDRIDGVDVTCIDSGMPVVLLRASDFGLSGEESPAELNRNESLKLRLNSLRLKLGPMMNLGDVTDKVIPKMSLLSAPRKGGNISTRTFIPHICHEAIGVLGAASVAAGCILPGSLCEDFSIIESEAVITVRVEHPSGHFDVTMELEKESEIPVIKKIGLLRTARMLMTGCVMVPASLWPGQGRES